MLNEKECINHWDCIGSWVDLVFNKKKTIAQALAEEIILTYEGNGESAALRKKNDSEKQADAAR